MEVHHHPQIHHNPKPWKEYFLEFVMIFLAVTMGFFAESLREHINDNARAKEFAISMCIDLKEDTASLVKYSKRIHFAAANIDTLFNLLSVYDPQQIPTGKLYWYGLFGGLPALFSPHDATLLEMKSSGSLRYFSNSKINRLVAGYDQLLQSFKLMDEHQQGIYTEVRKTRAQLFEFKFNDAANTVAQRMYTNFQQSSIDSFIKTNPPMLSNDKVLFNQYVEMVRSRFLKTQANLGDSLLRHATFLINVLKTEYNLNN